MPGKASPKPAPPPRALPRPPPDARTGADNRRAGTSCLTSAVSARIPSDLRPGAGADRAAAHAQDHAHDPAHDGAHGQGHDHAHDHSHDHTPAVTPHNERKVLLSFGLIFGFMLVEVAGGLWSGSLALLADAGHMLTDAAALALAYAAFRFGRRAADNRRTFGYLRFEVVAGFLNALTLFGIVVWIVAEAWRRFAQPTPVLAGPMLAVALAGLLVNLLVLWILTRGDRQHVNIRGAALHVLGDLLGSVGAVLAAGVIAATGFMAIDPILSVLVSLLILRSAWSLLKASLHILLEGAPDHAKPAQVAEHLRQQVPGVAEVRHVHVWQITSGRTLATLHVQPVDDEQARAVSLAVEQALRERFAIEHATIGIDWNGVEGAACSLTAPGRAPASAQGRPHAPAHEHAHAHAADDPHAHGLAHGPAHHAAHRH